VGIVEGSIDTILSVQVLCSVDANEVEAVVRGLYGLLKRGGKLVVYEHVGSEDWGSAGVQSLFCPLSLTFLNANTFSLFPTPSF